MKPVLLLLAAQTVFATTTVVFDPSSLFPSDALTVPDRSQKTGLRLNLPSPNCTAQPTACQEIALVNQLDGFSLRARANIRFSGPIDPATLREGILFVALENLTTEETGIHTVGQVIAVNQVTIDPATNTVYAKPDSVLDQHRRYALVVTAAVKDQAGYPVAPDPAYQSCVSQRLDDYCSKLAQALMGVTRVSRQIVGATVFTTMSATGWLQQARTVLDSVPPAVTLAQPRSTFHVPDLSQAVLHEQTGANPVKFSDFTLPVDNPLVSGIDRLILGSFRSPSFLQDDQSIPGVSTLADLAVPNRTNEVYFNALLPAGPAPPGGFPVVIFGHGFGDSRFGGPTAIAPVLNSAGFAVIAINAVGHGFGPQSTVTFVDKTGGRTTLPAGGRSLDLNGDGVIEANEGCALTFPVAFGTRDCYRQTAVDLMQLARVIRLGLDLDGDGRADLDRSRIYYAGESLGAIYGSMFTAVEPAVRAAALNVGGASTLDIARWSPAYRGLTTDVMRLRTPSLLNKGTSYDEDYVLPDQAPKIVTVSGAVAIQDVFERLEWLGMNGDPIAFAPHLRRAPLPGLPVRPILAQFARGDQTVPNIANSTLIRAAGLEASTWMYRHDLARAAAPELPLDPHPFLLLFISLGGGTVQLPGPAALAISLDAQSQIADFVPSDGATISDPNRLVRLLLGIQVFEIPASLPFDLGFLR